MARLLLFLSFLAIPVYASVLVAPDEYVLAGLLSLAIPAVTIVLIIALVYFAARRSRWAFLQAAVLVAGAMLFSSSFSFIVRKPALKNAFSMVTHNMNALQYYQHPERFDSNTALFQKWITKNNFDIICLQEMVEPKQKPFSIAGYARYASGKYTRDGDNLGLFIFSRLPIVREGKREFAFNSFNRLIWADVVTGRDTLRIVNVHLQSYDFYKFSIWKNAEKLKAGLRARSWHAKVIAEFLSECKYPVVLCGDFNEAPVSYPYRKINAILNDTFAGSGAGFAYTYRFAGIPVRIDYIFTDKTIGSSGYATSSEARWSDHRPVSVHIGRRAPD